MTQTPFLLDLDKLTQEQFDRAMASPGHGCSYSSPCILGAMMPPELVEALVAEGYDCDSVRYLEELDLIAFTSKGGAREIRVQESFDSIKHPHDSDRKNSKVLLKQLLPHLDHSGYE